MLWMFPGMLAYPGWGQDFTLNNMVVKMMFGLAKPFTGKNLQSYPPTLTV
jgi:hypothetical protein